MKEKGIVKWFSSQKGYGFIAASNGKDVFVHHKSILAEGYRSLNEGDKVEFDMIKGAKGDQADNVKVVN